MGTEYKIFDDRKGGTLNLFEMSSEFTLSADSRHTTFEFKKDLTIVDLKQMILELVKVWSYFIEGNLEGIANELKEDILTLY